MASPVPNIALKTIIARHELLHELAEKLSKVNSIDEVYKVIAAKAPCILAGKIVSICHWESGTEALDFRLLDPSEGLGEALFHLDTETSQIGQVILSQRGSILSNEAIGYKQEFPLFREQNILSGIAAPLITGGKSVGSLNLFYDVAENYDDFDLQILNQIATLLASTIENQRLVAQTKQALAHSQAQSRRLILLNELAVKLSETTTYAEAFDTSINYLDLIMDSSRCSLALIEKPTNELVLFGAKGAQQGPNKTLRLPLARTCLYKLNQSRSLLYQASINAEDFAENPILLKLGMRSSMSMPIFRNKEVIGSLNIAKDKAHGFTDEHKHLLSQISSLLSRTLENQSLLSQSDQSYETIESMKTRFEMVLNNIEYGVLFMDADLNLLIANRAAKEMWGFPDEFVASN
ncbi:MAG: GAF domain-containing protein, partial [Bacteroidota bacterium]